MNNHQLIIQALDLIEDRLTTFLPVAVLSKEMGYSLYHFTRLFQAVTGIAPGDYIARRKITEAYFRHSSNARTFTPGHLIRL